MNLSIADQLQYITVRIEVELSDGGVSTGTGFFFRMYDSGEKHIPVVVTNKHVVAGGRIGTFKITSANDDGSPDDSKHVDVLLDNLENRFTGHPDPNVDLAVLPIAPLLQ